MANMGIICKIIICTLLCPLADVFGGSCGSIEFCETNNSIETCYSDKSCDIDLKNPNVLVRLQLIFLRDEH